MSSDIGGAGGVAGSERAAVAVGATPDEVATSIGAEGVRSTCANASERGQRRPGMSFGHDVLLALIMAVAMTATVLLYR